MTKNNEGLAMYPYGNGWKWTERTQDGRGVTYRTNRSGEGLFQLDIDPSGQESWRQLKGTGQFRLSSNKAQALYTLKGRVASEGELTTLRGNF